MNFPARPACQLVPQATIFTSRKFRNSSSLISISSRNTLPDFLRNSAKQGVANGARLLENLLLHEMLEAALLGHDRVPGDMLGSALDSRFSKSNRRTPCGVRTAISPSPRKNTLRVCASMRGNVAGHEKFIRRPGPPRSAVQAALRRFCWDRAPRWLRGRTPRP